MDYFQLNNSIKVALSKGARQLTQSSFYWNVAADCESPVIRELFARPFIGDSPARPGVYDYGDVHPVISKDWLYTPGKRHSLRLTIEARCRSCPRCLANRASIWRMRAKQEIAIWPRTWFGTLTLRQEEHYRVLLETSKRLRLGRVELDKLNEAERFSEIVKTASPRLTRWLKRVRKRSGAKLRYCLVAEQHKSGQPHWHILVHQCSEATLTYRHLSETWTDGFTNFKLVVDTAAAGYVAKYLSKSLLARVRASQRYGQSDGVPFGEDGLTCDALKGIVNEMKRETPTLNKNPLVF